MSDLSATSWVSQDTTLTCQDETGWSVGVPTTLSYTADDPYAVCLTFHVGETDVTWEVERSLLFHGLAVTSGSGDVRVRPGGPTAAGEDSVVLELTSPDGHLVAAAAKREVEVFLLRTCALVPLGAESSFLDVDGVVERLLA